jgi:hypothetical protein
MEQTQTEGDRPVDEMKGKIESFLKKHGMFHADISIEKTCGLFQDEMNKGLAGADSSLAMLPTYIETER